MTRLAWQFLAAGVYALAAIGVIYLGLAISDRDPPVVFETARALSPSVPQGGTLPIEFIVYRWRKCAVFGDRDVVDAMGQRHVVTQYTRGLSEFVGREPFRRTISIPDDAAVGPARYEVSLRYYCNPIHRLGFPILVTAPVIKFDITPATALVPFGLPAPSGGE